eukprot:7064530-Karenia_brevis.AAC.1
MTNPYTPTPLGDANGKWTNNPDSSIAPGLALIQYQGRTYNRNKKIPEKLDAATPGYTVGRGKDGKWFPNVHEIERWCREVARACADASPLTDHSEIDFVYDICVNFVKDSHFSDVSYNSEWDRLAAKPDGDRAYMQAIDKLIKDYLWEVIPESFARRIKQMDE